VTALKSVPRSVGARLLLILASTVGLLVTASAPALAYPAHQPDLLLGNISTGQCCLGAGRYEAWPDNQQLPASVKRGGQSILMVPLYNDGTSADSVRIVGERSYSGVQVRYFRGRTGDHDITAAVVQGRYFVSNLKPGGRSSAVLRIVVTAPSAAVGFSRSVRVIARAVGTPHAMDAASFTVTVVK
jgi:hypothetical protein